MFDNVIRRISLISILLIAVSALWSRAHADVYVAIGNSSSTYGVMKFNDDGSGGKVLFTTSTDTIPRGLTIGLDGNLYVCYAGSGNIVAYDSQTGAQLGVFVAKGTGGLISPITPRFESNLLYVTDFGQVNPTKGGPFTGQVLTFNLNGTFKDQLIGPSSTFPGLVSAYGMDFDAKGNIDIGMPDGDLATDDNNDPGYGCALGYTPSGEFIGITANNPNDPAFGGKTPPDYNFRGIAFYPDKSKLFAALENATDGTNVGAVGVYASSTTDLIKYIGPSSLINMPLDVEMGPVDNNLYVVNIGNGRVDEYRSYPPYDHLSTFASSLNSPSAIAFRQLRRLTPPYNPVTAGHVVSVSLFLNTQAGNGGLVVTLASSNTAVATVPASVIVPAGERTVAFKVTTLKQKTNETVTISGSYTKTTASTTLNIITTSLSGFKLTPISVTGGSPVTGTVTLTAIAPTGGYTVSLSSASKLIKFPASVSVPSGSKTASFTITTSAVTSTKTAVITAAFGGNSKAVKLTITK